MRMLILRFLPLLLPPILILLEIVSFIVVGGELGVLPTLGLVVLTAVAGLALVAAQGVHHLSRLRRTLAAGEVPVADMIHGLLLLVAGFLLLVPGFITDACGGLLLLPPVRAAIGRGLLRRWRSKMQARDGVTIIEGEFREPPPDHPPEDPRGGKLPPPGR